MHTSVDMVHIPKYYLLKIPSDCLLVSLVSKTAIPIWAGLFFTDWCNKSSLGQVLF